MVSLRFRNQWAQIIEFGLHGCHFDHLAGNPVIRGKPSEDFHPYVTLGSLLKVEDARDKLMVDFDPTRCLLEDLKVKMTFLASRGI